jgi:hypothetical protein
LIDEDDIGSKERKEDSGAIGGIDKRLWPEDLWFVESCKEIRSMNSGDVDWLSLVTMMMTLRHGHQNTWLYFRRKDQYMWAVDWKYHPRSI